MTGLLTRAAADPTVLSQEGKTAFELAGDRATRDAFRVARGEMGEGRWDWEAARVPAALGKKEVEERAEREKLEKEREEGERRRREEERLKVEGPQVGDVGSGKGRKGGVLVLSAGPRKTAEERRAEEARGLTGEQKLRLERERRARAAEERMRRLQSGGE